MDDGRTGPCRVHQFHMQVCYICQKVAAVLHTFSPHVDVWRHTAQQECKNSSMIFLLYIRQVVFPRNDIKELLHL